MERILEAVERYNGVITILWHNMFMTGAPPGSLKILDGCEKGAWMTSCREIGVVAEGRHAAPLNLQRVRHRDLRVFPGG